MHRPLLPRTTDHMMFPNPYGIRTSLYYTRRGILRIYGFTLFCGHKVDITSRMYVSTTLNECDFVQTLRRPQVPTSPKGYGPDHLHVSKMFEPVRVPYFHTRTVILLCCAGRRPVHRLWHPHDVHIHNPIPKPVSNPQEPVQCPHVNRTERYRVRIRYLAVTCREPTEYPYACNQNIECGWCYTDFQRPHAHTVHLKTRAQVYNASLNLRSTLRWKNKVVFPVTRPTDPVN